MKKTLTYFSPLLIFLAAISYSWKVLGFNSSSAVPPALIEELKQRRELIRAWAPFCEDGSASHGHCPFGDMTIFSGIACLVGETDRCDDVRRAQGPDGRWWRSPQLVGNDQEINTFSRDQSKGALAYLITTKDVNAALRWQAYLDSHHQRMCPRASDNRCVITAGTGRLFGAVWKYLGLTPAKWMKKSGWYEGIYNPLEALFQPADYPMHLTALNVWLRQEIARRGGPRAPKIDRTLMNILVRREPTNPFFQLVRSGPSPRVAELILSKCLPEKPTAEILDWSWQRSQKKQPWLHRSGHDCIFIIDLFEQKLKIEN